MKQFLIKLLLDAIIDYVILALAEMSRRSDNDIDDQTVELIQRNREQLKIMVKERL